MAKVGNGGMGRVGMMTPLGIIFLAIASAGFPTRSLGQAVPRASTKVYFDTSHKADADLRSADNHAKAGDYAEAVEIYQRVIQQFGDKVVEVPLEPKAGANPDEEDSRLSVNARRECQRRIAALPPEARALYRARVDGQAERWFRQGREGRDRSILRRIVDQDFCSSWGDDALDLLGDLAFQEGQFAEALAAYTQLVPDRPGGGLALAHPDPSVDLARVAAKKLLCRVAMGEHPPTLAEVEAFVAAHPNAAGPFAGRKGLLGRDLIDAIRDDHLSPSVPVRRPLADVRRGADEDQGCPRPDRRRIAPVAGGT